MDQHLEETQLAAMEDTARKIGSPNPNFLKDNIYGIMTTNVISQYIYNFSKHFGSFVLFLLRKPLLVLVSLGLYVLRARLNGRKKDAALENDVEVCIIRRDGIKRDLDRAKLTLEELDESRELGQSNAYKSVRQRKQSQKSWPTSSPRPCEDSEEITTIEEGSCSEPSANLKGKSIVTEGNKEFVAISIALSMDETVPVKDVKGLLRINFGRHDEPIIRTLHGSKILYNSLSVKLDEDLLRRARNIVKDGAKFDKNFTLQIEDWGIYYYDQNGDIDQDGHADGNQEAIQDGDDVRNEGRGQDEVQDSSTEERVKLFIPQEDQVPTIFSAEYAIGVLRIYGLHLEGAEIKAATSSKSKKLVTSTFQEICGGKIGMLSYKDVLPDANLRNLYVYAIKPTPLSEGERIINIRSSAVKIDDIHLKKGEQTTMLPIANVKRAVSGLLGALRDWIPATFTGIFVARQLWLLAKPLWNAASAFYPELYWTLPMLLITICTWLLPAKAEEWIAENLWSLCFAYSRLREYFGSLRYLGSNTRDNQENQAVTAKTEKSEKLNNPSSQRLSRRDLVREIFSRRDTDTDSESDSEFEDRPARSHKQSDTQFNADTFEVEGETILLTPLEWEWDSVELVKDKRNKLVERKRVRGTPESKDTFRDTIVPFRVIYDLYSEEPWPEQLYVHIKSDTLLDVVEKLLPNTKQAPILSRSNVVGIEGKKLFLVLDKLKDELHKYTIRTDGGTRVRADHQLQRQLSHLVRFLDKEYTEPTSRYKRMDRQVRVSWDMLWIFLRPGEEVVYKNSVSGEEVCGIVEKTRYQIDEERRCWVLLVRLKVYDYNCKTFQSYTTFRLIDQFEGEILFQELDVYPSRFPGKEEASEKHFLNQGARFGYLSTKARCRYMHYTGIMFRYVTVNNCLRLVKEKANGRVMIDLASFYKMNPDYKLGNAEPPCDVIRDNQVVEMDISEVPYRKFAPCIVYGFSFRLKRWGAFSVCGFDEIKYNLQAWDELVMNRDLKELTEVLVGDHVRKDVIPDNVQQSGLDTISNKGDSCIVLCYGPPGTGKTLTAEALADKCRAPLWAMSVSELGITPNMLESQLVNIFEVAHSWHALLLLDEADIYMERRSDGLNLERNAMTGIFLRQVEYYKGVLFLTTNRVSTFDDAFLSRITLFLSYRALNVDQRKQIWVNFLNNVKIAANEENDDIVDKVSVYELNGRQIRNVIQNAESFARRQGSKIPFGSLVIQTAKTMSASLAGVAERRSV